LRPQLLDAIARASGRLLNADGPAEAAQPGRTREANALNILVAEDNPVNRRLVCRLLEGRGYRVLAVDNGQKAVDAFKAQAFDLVLMDVQMAVMGGFEATRQIRQLEQPTGAHVPIIALTAHSMKGDDQRCLASGMDAHLSKPIRFSEFFQLVGRLLPGSVIAHNANAAPTAAKPTSA
jgi:CheY-like chemotaxis protein